AIPHGRFNELDHMIAFFVKLHKKVDYDAVDDRPVDLIFLLLTPETEGSDHLQALAAISRQMRDPRLCAKIRKEKSVDALYELLTHDAQMADAL
ncbi:MAG: PTS sugar transporter subunit IIA, partial [Alphaproteobacteria bacterium]